MIDGVNKIIAQRLLSSNGVFLPSVGSIIVKLKSAEVSGKKQITAPSRVLDFSSKEEGVSIVELIAQSAECSAEQAEELYQSYLTEVKRDNGIEIAGVGTLTGKSFKIYKSFAEQLNPQSGSQATLPKSPAKGGDNTLLIAIVAALAAAVIAYFLFDIYSKRKAAERVVEVVEIVEPEPVIEPEPEPAPPTEKISKFGVVYGVYSTPENVERSKGEIAALFGQAVEITVYPFHSKSVVVIFESERWREAQNFLNTNYDDIPDSWVYEIK